MGDEMAVRGTSTKERIMDAAQELFGRHGLEGTSLRAVTNAAGANLAAVNYHFGSKEELFRAVVWRVMGPVAEEHRRRMEEMAGSSPSVEELLDAFLGPFVRLISGQPDRSLARFVGRVLADTDERLWRQAAVQTEAADAMYLEAFGRALPHLSRDELVWRFYAILATMVFQLLGAPVMDLAGRSPFGARAGDAEETRARAITFLAAGLRAQASDLATNPATHGGI